MKGLVAFIAALKLPGLFTSSVRTCSVYAIYCGTRLRRTFADSWIIIMEESDVAVQQEYSEEKSLVLSPHTSSSSTCSSLEI